MRMRDIREPKLDRLTMQLLTQFKWYQRLTERLKVMNVPIDDPMHAKIWAARRAVEDAYRETLKH